MCNLVDAVGHCAPRAARVNLALWLCGEAMDAIRELEARTKADQLDLFDSAPTDAAIEFWRGVHAACAREHRRVSRVFWRRCRHPYAYRTLDGEARV